MNIYDEANNLAKAIRESNEYINYHNAKNKLAENNKHLKMVKDFMKMQFELQSMQLMGKEVPEKQIESLNSMYTNLMSISDIAEFFQVQRTFGTIIQDVTKIIGEVADLDLDFLKDE